MKKIMTLKIYYTGVKKNLLLSEKNISIDFAKNLSSKFLNDFPDELQKFLISVFLEANIGDKQKTRLAEIILENFIEIQKVEPMFLFISENKSLLEKICPKYLIYETQAYIIKSDYENAKKNIEKILKIEGISKQHDFLVLKKAVELMSMSSLKINIDWDIESNILKINEIGEEKNIPKLANFGRNLILNKSSALFEINPFLFSSALRRYKEELKKYSGLITKIYENYLQALQKSMPLEEFELIKNKLDFNQIPSCGKRELPSLDSIKFSQIQIGENFSPILYMPEGYLEYIRGIKDISKDEYELIPASLTVLDSKLFAQNSRCIIAFDNSLLWVFKTENYKFNEELGRDVFPLKTTIKSVSKDGKIFARLQDKTAFSIFSLDMSNGKLNWKTDLKEWSFSSDPIIYKGKIVAVAKKNAIIPEYWLLFIDVISGKIIDNIFLFSGGGNEIPTAFGRVRTDFSIQLISDGDFAFICPNNGVLLSVDISSSSILWARKYCQTPLLADRKLSQNAVNRKLSPPICSSENVLFAPFDSVSVFLLDKRSGELIKEETSFNWRQFLQCGEEYVAMVDSVGNLNFISLKDLSVSSSIQGNFLLFDGLQFYDGLIAKNNENLLKISTKGKIIETINIPPEFIPQHIYNNNIYGYIKKNNLPLVGKLSQTVEEMPKIASSYVEQNITNLVLPLFKTAQKSIYISSENYLQRLGENFKPSWAFPVSYRPSSVIEAENFTFVSNNFDKTVTVLNTETGDPVVLFPEKKFSLDFLKTTIADGGQIRVFIKRKYSNNTEIYEFKNDKFNLIAEIKNNNPIFVADRGSSIYFRENDRDLKLFEEKDGKYENTAKLTLKDNYYDYAVVTSLKGNTYLINRGSGIFSLSKNNFISIFDAKSDRWDWNINNHTRMSNSLLSVLFTSTNILSIYEDEKGKIIPINDYKFCNFPSIVNGIIIGATSTKTSKDDKSPFGFVIYDIKNNKLIHYEEPDIYEVMIKSWAKPSVFLSVLCGKKAFFFIENNDQRNRFDDFALYTVDIETKKTNLQPFPELGFECSGVIPAQNGFAALIDSELKYFQKEIIESVGNISQSVFEGELKNDFYAQIDGYPDEWDLNNFTDAQNGIKVSSVLSNKDNKQLIFMAININSTEIIKKIGEKGINSKYKLVLLHGARASFNKKRIEGALKAPFEKNDLWKYDFSMLPTGDNCFIEVQIPATIFYDNFIHTIKNTKSLPRDMRGDIAFNIVLEEENGEQYSILQRDPLEPINWIRFKYLIDDETKINKRKEKKKK